MNDQGGEPSFFQRLLHIGAKLVAMAEKHFRLLSLEAREEAEARMRLACAVAVAVTIGLFAFLLLNCAIVLFIATATGAWAATLAGAGLFHSALATLLGWRIHRWWKTRPEPFVASRDEFEKTREWLAQLWPTRSNPRN